MNRSTTLTLALAQLDLTVGDIRGNEEKLADAVSQARAEGAQLVLVPELAVTGYPAEDLWLKEHFLADAWAAVGRIARATEGICALIGFPEHAEDVFNACAVCVDGEVRAVYRKQHLPNYGVFDEQRYFQAGAQPALIEVQGHLVGLTVCEDMWEPGPPAADECNAGALLLTNLSASPYHAGKGSERERMFTQRARDYAAAVAFCNHVGGQDELVFDGHSLVVDHLGEIVARAPQFEEALLLATVDVAGARALRLREAGHRPAARRRPEVPVVARVELPAAEAVPMGGEIAPLLGPEAEVYAALALGLRDYVEKNGFAGVVLGLSGGIDSALVACLARDALGPERVHAVVMPSPHSSTETQADARTLAAALGIDARDLPIAAAMAAYDEILAESFAGTEPGLAEENIQARIRGNLLMALSNKLGWLVLTTGNKSEMSVGYSTLYGDLAGGFALIKDVPKTLVYALVRHRNAAGWPGGPQAPVPVSIIERAPSAELRPDQRDEDSLPPYPLLDAILAGYVEEDLAPEALVARGLPDDVVAKVVALVDRAEYKRRQAPPGVRISTRAFGRDRRMPITSRYRG